MFQQSKINQILTTTSENYYYNYTLDHLTKFNSISLNSQCLAISLNFGFKDIKFEKKTNDFIFFFNGVFDATKMHVDIFKKKYN